MHYRYSPTLSARIYSFKSVIKARNTLKNKSIRAGCPEETVRSCLMLSSKADGNMNNGHWIIEGGCLMASRTNTWAHHDH